MLLKLLQKKLERFLKIPKLQKHLSGNRGEWSEIYVFFYLLAHGRLYAADQNLAKINPLKYRSSLHPNYHYKFKKLLTECAVGMLPGKIWNGYADATGGYIVVREDGEVLCYHLFNRNEFEEYLLTNTKFETASSSRHNFGSIYKQGDKYFIKLNLQVRFMK